jgi:hypothetical protein
MTHHHSVAGARRAARWTSVHVRRHIPFAVYTVMTLVLMVWMMITMARI